MTWRKCTVSKRVVATFQPAEQPYKNAINITGKTKARKGVLKYGRTKVSKRFLIVSVHTWRRNPMVTALGHAGVEVGKRRIRMRSVDSSRSHRVD